MTAMTEPEWPTGRSLRFCQTPRRKARSGWRGIGLVKFVRWVADRMDGMNCVCCGSEAVTERPEVTAQGYRRFRCRECGRQFNERSGGVLNRTSLPSDIIAFVVFCRLRYRLTLRDLSEILLLRGIEVSHEAIRNWEAKLLPIMGEELRKRRYGTRRGPGASWYVDETYLKVRGKWVYLYRAVDRDGNLIDAMLSEHRDMAAAKAFFRSAQAAMGFRPDRVTTDGHGSYPRAIWTTLRRWVRHRTNVYLNNRLEQDHRGIKGRIRCMRVQVRSGRRSLLQRARRTP
jgi:putative transposase